jgi:tRNA-Thr(GGU) m(6)t(6)A37 methyltransferase TsaA
VTALAGRRWFRAQAIGTVRRPVGAPADPEAFYDPRAETTLEILPRLVDGLAGIEGYSHLVVLYWLDRARRPRAVPPPAPAEGQPALPPVGLFATRTPRRPNPIGLACPALLRRSGNLLVVSGIDAWDETPILDVKGYAPRDEGRPDASVPPWLDALWRRHDAERGAPPPSSQAGGGVTASLDMNADSAAGP